MPQSVLDNVDGDMSAIVEVTLLDDRAVYTVTDSSGNEAVVEREIPGGMDAPEIVLNDGAALTVSASMSWEDPGYSVTDAQGRDLSGFVTVEGSVVPYRSGEYELSYTLSNTRGETVTATRLVTVEPGEYTTLFRFPGGSSNTVSNFNPGIMSRLTKTMTDMGYYYFDWNVTSGDAGETTDTDEVYWNVVNGCGSNVNVVLQHDIKGFSVAAVERIIIWGLNNGYQFLPLEESSYGAHHGVNN